MESTTLATGREGSEASGGDWRERETRGGHFMSHIALSALLVSKNSLSTLLPLLFFWPLLVPPPCSSMGPRSEREREREGKEIAEGEGLPRRTS